MRKTGILNQALLNATCSLGHTDTGPDALPFDTDAGQPVDSRHIPNTGCDRDE